MKAAREGERAAWDQVSRKKGKGRGEEHVGGERRDRGALEDEEQERGFQARAELRNLKGRAGGSARQTGKRRERKWNNDGKPDHAFEKRGETAAMQKGQESRRERVAKKVGSRRVAAREAASRAGLREGGGGGRRWNKQNTTRAGKEPLKECLPSRRKTGMCVFWPAAIAQETQCGF